MTPSPISVAFVMDPPDVLDIRADTTFVLMLEAQREVKLRARIALEDDSKVYKDDATGETYGQVKRKKSDIEKASHDVDED